MLVDAYKTCIDQLQGSVDGCSVFEASRDEDKAWHCQPKGEVVAEVRRHTHSLRATYTAE